MVNRYSKPSKRFKSVAMAVTPAPDGQGLPLDTFVQFNGTPPASRQAALTRPKRSGSVKNFDNGG